MNLLLTGAFRCTNTETEKLKKLGCDIDFLQNESDVIRDYSKYDAVICNGLFLHHNIGDFKNLKYIQLTSAGYDRVPMDYIESHNIEIHNARGVYSIPLAEHAVLKILEIYKKSYEFYKKQAIHNWEKDRHLQELYGKQTAILGCGSVGIEIAKRLKAFGVAVTGVDIVEIENDYIDKYEPLANIVQALNVSDIVILTLPLNKQTEYMFNANLFQNMKKTAILVNVSRGRIIRQPDLIDALKKNLIFGAALDVFEDEPLQHDSELWDMDNVIITPHNSFVGEGNHQRLFKVIYDNLKDWNYGRNI